MSTRAVAEKIVESPDRGEIMRVWQWMRTPVETVRPRDSVTRARTILEDKRINQLPVVVEERVIGIVTDRDLRDAFPSVFDVPRKNRLAKSGTDPESVTVEQVMSQNVLSIAPGDGIEHAAAVMRKERVGALPVIDEGRLVGIITRSDVLMAFELALGALSQLRRPAPEKLGA